MKHPRVDIRKIYSADLCDGVREILFLTQAVTIEHLHPRGGGVYRRSPDEARQREAGYQMRVGSRRLAQDGREAV